jgi:putative colanic acid biosynthesis acetyltransferase WcaF
LSESVNDGPSAVAVDSPANRAAQKYSAAEQARRITWSFGRWLIRLSPRPCFAWRRAVLRLFGARVGAEAHIYPTAHLYMPWNVEIGDWAAVGEDVLIYSLGKVRIGNHATLSYRAHVCAGTHDLEDPTLPLLKPAVTIGAAVWIGTDAFIGPGVTVGEGAVVGARSVVVKDVEPFNIVAGNPARLIRRRKLRPERPSC